MISHASYSVDHSPVIGEPLPVIGHIPTHTSRIPTTDGTGSLSDSSTSSLSNHELPLPSTAPLSGMGMGNGQTGGPPAASSLMPSVGMLEDRISSLGCAIADGDDGAWDGGCSSFPLSNASMGLMDCDLLRGISSQTQTQMQLPNMTANGSFVIRKTERENSTGQGLASDFSVTEPAVIRLTSLPQSVTKGSRPSSTAAGGIGSDPVTSTSLDSSPDPVSSFPMPTDQDSDGMLPSFGQSLPSDGLLSRTISSDSTKGLFRQSSALPLFPFSRGLSDGSTTGLGLSTSLSTPNLNLANFTLPVPPPSLQSHPAPTSLPSASGAYSSHTQSQTVVKEEIGPHLDCAGSFVGVQTSQSPLSHSHSLPAKRFKPGSFEESFFYNNPFPTATNYSMPLQISVVSSPTSSHTPSDSPPPTHGSAALSIQHGLAPALSAFTSSSHIPMLHDQQNPQMLSYQGGLTQHQELSHSASAPALRAKRPLNASVWPSQLSPMHQQQQQLMQIRQQQQRQQELQLRAQQQQLQQQQLHQQFQQRSPYQSHQFQHRTQPQFADVPLAAQEQFLSRSNAPASAPAGNMMAITPRVSALTEALRAGVRRQDGAIVAVAYERDSSDGYDQNTATQMQQMRPRDFSPSSLPLPQSPANDDSYSSSAGASGGSHGVAPSILNTPGSVTNVMEHLALHYNSPNSVSTAQMPPSPLTMLPRSQLQSSSPPAYELASSLAQRMHAAVPIAVDYDLPPGMSAVAMGLDPLMGPYPIQGDKWRKYKCQFCGKGFCNRSGVERHERTHTGEAPFPCEVCGKRFKQKGTLKDHERIHSGEKAFECPNVAQCGKKFRHRSSLHRHMDKCPASQPPTQHTSVLKFQSKLM